MKWLIILGLLIMVAVLIAVRYRRQIQMAIYFWRMLRKMREMNRAEEKHLDKKEESPNIPLVRCARCSTWMPQTNALKLRKGVFYCSANCMEKSVVE